MTPEQAVINTILNGGPPCPAPYHIEYSESRPHSGQSRRSLQVPNVMSDSASSCSFGIKSDNEESEISRPATSQANSLFEFEQEITAQTEVTLGDGHSPPTTIQEIYPIDPISATFAAEAQSQSIAIPQTTNNLKTMELTPSKRGQVHRDKRETWQTCRNEKKLLRIFPINDISKDNSDVTVWDYNNDGTSNTSVHFFWSRSLRISIAGSNLAFSISTEVQKAFRIANTGAQQFLARDPAQKVLSEATNILAIGVFSLSVCVLTWIADIRCQFPSDVCLSSYVWESNELDSYRIHLTIPSVW